MKERLIQKMKALSNECRVDLLLELARADQPVRVGELAAAVGVGEARVSRSLQILSYAGLVVARRKGTRVFYELNKGDCVAISLSGCLLGALESEKEPKTEK
ncbi:MAG: winged helix-turn-helix transcriptional regulator [Acidobacteria bacterium]|nr:winged helix-turn-helix transcriptional regulator [Acidobacteriota bacterium]